MERAQVDEIDAARSEGRRHSGAARGRIASLLDDGSFVEFGELAESRALVGGVGTVGGQPVVVASFDGGAHTTIDHVKAERLVSLAHAHRWPFVCWVAGQGAPDGRRSEPGPGIYAGAAPFRLFEGLAELSGWAPSVAVLDGTALSGNTAIAFLSDVVIATRGSSFGMWSSGAIEAVTRGAEEHVALGDIDVVVDDGAAAEEAVRRFLSYQFDLPAGEPAPDADRIGDYVPDSRRSVYDMRKIVAAFADRDSVLELRPHWGRSLITALARLDGRAIGILANQPLSPIAGAIDADAADKISRFVEMCDAYGLPIVSFIDNPGFMVGPKAEEQGIARHHARPLAALHHRSVPVFGVQIRKAYGLGPFAMIGWGTSKLPELRLAWPSVESGGMSLEGAALLVRRQEIRAAQTRAEVRAIQDDYASTMRHQRAGLNAGRSFAFDDIIAPSDTRARILAMLRLTPRSRRAEKAHYIDSI